MSKQIAPRLVLIGIGALVIGLAGCSSPPPAPPPAVNAPVPPDVIEKLKHMPPEQQQQVIQQMRASNPKAADQMQKSLDGSPSQGASSGGQ